MNSFAIRHSKNIDKASPSCYGLRSFRKSDGTAGGNAVENSIPNMLFLRIVIQNETLNILKSLWESIKNLFSK